MGGAGSKQKLSSAAPLLRMLPIQLPHCKGHRAGDSASKSLTVALGHVYRAKAKNLKPEPSLPLGELGGSVSHTLL